MQQKYLDLSAKLDIKESELFPEGSGLSSIPMKIQLAETKSGIVLIQSPENMTLEDIFRELIQSQGGTIKS